MSDTLPCVSLFLTLSTLLRELFFCENQVVSIFISVVPCFYEGIPCLVILSIHKVSEHLAVVSVIDVVHHGIVKLQSWLFWIASCGQELQKLFAQVLWEKSSIIDRFDPDLLSLWLCPRSISANPSIERKLWSTMEELVPGSSPAVEPTESIFHVQEA